MNRPEPRRGDVFWIAFDPSLGGEIRKTRPAVIVSNDVANRILNRVQVVPLSSQVSHIYPAEILLRVAGRDAKAMAHQLTTVSKQRLRERMTRLSETQVRDVERTIRLQLHLI